MSLEMEAMEDYAIVKTGGKQYRVQSGDVIRVESLPAYRGDVVELSEVLMASRDDAVFVGSPTLPGAKVITEVVDRGRDKKVIVFTYKAKTRNRKKNGHRQQYTDLRVTGIEVDVESISRRSTDGA